MLQGTGVLEQIVNQLSLILEENTEIKKQLEVFNERFVAFERSVTVNSRHVQETKTLVRRIKPYIEKAMTTLHQAFKLVCNGILNQREELSEYAGTVINTNYDREYMPNSRVNIV